MGGDCDDTNAQRNPGATEIANNFKDDDCDGVGDVGSDQDADGFNGPEDCDDTNSLDQPGATETFDGLDQNCDGMADEIFYKSARGVGYAGASSARPRRPRPPRPMISATPVNPGSTLMPGPIVVARTTESM